jgi:hypothetical protein
MAGVEGVGVSRLKPMHSDAEIRVGRLQNEVNMVGH